MVAGTGFDEGDGRGDVGVVFGETGGEERRGEERRGEERREWDFSFVGFFFLWIFLFSESCGWMDRPVDPGELMGGGGGWQL